MAISNLPASPARSDTPTNFITKADALIAALPTFVTEANNTAAAMNLNSTNDNSTSSVLIGLGSKSFTVSAAKSFQPGMYLVVADTAAPTTNSMSVQVTSYAGTSLVVNCLTLMGAGTIANWKISQSVGFTPLDSSVTNAKLAQAYINDLTTVAYDPADFVAIADASDAFNKKKALLTNRLESITAVANTPASGVTITIPAQALQFRSATLTDGAPVTRTNAAAAALVVASGVPLGAISTIASRMLVLAVDNGTTFDTAVSNIASGTNLDETGLITTEAITVGCTFTGSIAVTTGILTLTTALTGALTLKQSISGTGVNSGTYVIALLSGVLGANGSTYSTNQITAAASTTITGSAGMGIYSTAALTNRPYKLMGFYNETQTVAGTHSAALTLVQGSGGNALTAMSSIGYGQTPQTVTRTSGTTYYNTTNKPQWLNRDAPASIGTTIITSTISINGGTAITFIATPVAGSNGRGSGVALLPPGCSYVITDTNALSPVTTIYG